MPLARLSDLLEYLALPGREEIWLLLDIKVFGREFRMHLLLKLTLQLDNDANDVMRLVAETIKQVPAHPQKPWNQRVVLGCWAVRMCIFLGCNPLNR